MGNMNRHDLESDYDLKFLGESSCIYYIHRKQTRTGPEEFNCDHPGTKSGECCKEDCPLERMNDE